MNIPFKANTSKHKAMSYKRLKEQELHPDKTIEDKKQISFADHDARIMGKNGRFDYSLA